MGKLIKNIKLRRETIREITQAFKLHEQEDLSSSSQGTVENLITAIRFGANVSIVVKEILEDGKIKAVELLKFIPILFQLPKSINAIKNSVPGLKDLTEAERTQLVNLIIVEFNIPSGKIEPIAEESLKIAFSIYEIVKILRS